MQVQRFVYGAIGLWVAIASTSLAHFLPLSSFPVIGRPAIASSESTVAFERMGLPRSVANTVRRTFQRDYQNRIDNIRIAHVKLATWEDCNPDLPQGRFSYRSCETTPRRGWRVIIMAEFPTINQTVMRTYYVDRRSGAVASPLEDVSEDMRSHIATTLQVSPGNLQILAAPEETVLPATACPDGEFCPIPPIYLGWRILAMANGRDHIVRLRGIGSPIPTNTWFDENDEGTLGTLPAALANAVMQDAQERFNTPELILATAPDAPANIGVQVESIQPVAWNECGGGGGPSQPMRGACPNVTASGWRVVVAGGVSSEPLRLVYYIRQGAGAGDWTLDGLQSLSEAAQRRILAQVAEDTGIPTSGLRLFWADARFFDRCLNTREGVPSCGMDIRPGWAVQILVDQTIPGTAIQQTLLVYHTNITGTDVRLVSQGPWMPPQ
ncbi:hypothetical protein [Leptothoe sp. PORK10 BA2]|uniref:hypothetical protein n=1 Tax=Leptothoe sp. PORK10 BA2 TaxID=3110254 RepID=UPI002B20FA10|nr:hypothetical protein [Leptothoe sp. PORK10 BA2]MEA5466492.1 hypothetical protein [Leptothoe sp. PORK10 BA2]